jgi:3-carboxy-cis,cis-muconate cycloisomerase
MQNYHLYRDCFSTPEMRAIWCEEASISAWLKVEQVLARCQADIGLIPAEAATAIEAVSFTQINQERLKEKMMFVGRPVVGLIEQLRELTGTYAQYVHLNSTTQDIMDTAMSMQMKLGLEDIQTSIKSIIILLERLNSNHGDTLIIGRTNGQHALPMKLSNKLRVWKAELCRRSVAIADAASRGVNAQVGGPLGDLRQYEGSQGAEVKQAVADRLKLNIVDPHWQSSRDGLMDIVLSLGSLCASICKVSHNVNLLCSSDIEEMSECYSAGRGASSSMKHKKNQRASEFAEAVARLGRQRAEQIGELTLQQHERSGGVWIGEWVVIPEVFLFSAGALNWFHQLIENLEINTEAMNTTAMRG